jgi:hypothetical protein
MESAIRLIDIDLGARSARIASLARNHNVLNKIKVRIRGF